MQGVGFQRLRKAYDILEGFEDDEVEVRGHVLFTTRNVFKGHFFLILWQT